MMASECDLHYEPETRQPLHLQLRYSSLRDIKILPLLPKFLAQSACYDHKQ